ncbi:hypothetical protein GCM10009563_20190 [Subtercola frigoramans]
MRDEVSVPDGFEEPVGETEREDVLGRLLAQKVIDPKDLVLEEGLVQLGVDLDGAR